MYILICDDEPAVARQVEQLARQHLEQRGIPVQCAVCTRGEEVLARSDLAQYQLALLDVDLETMTGIALGRRLKQQNPELVLVYISAYLDEEENAQKDDARDRVMQMTFGGVNGEQQNVLGDTGNEEPEQE